MGIINTNKTVIMLSLYTSIQIANIFRLGIDCKFQPISMGDWTKNKRNAFIITGATSRLLKEIKQILEINLDKPEFYNLTQLTVPKIILLKDFVELHKEGILKDFKNHFKKHKRPLPAKITTAMLEQWVLYFPEWVKKAIKEGVILSKFMEEEYNTSIKYMI